MTKGILYPNLKHLEAIALTAKLGSTLASSNQLNLTQSAVSQGISSVEAFFDTNIFTRSKTGMFVTEEGNILLNRLEPALKRLSEKIKGFSNKDIKALRIITTTQLRAFVAVEQHGNFANAAQAEGLSQPSIHRAARDFEKIIGETLFEKTSFGLAPTKLSRNIAREIRLFFYELSQISDDLSIHQGHHKGRCTIGAMPLARSHIVPAAVSNFQEKHPDFHISIVGAPYGDLIAGLRNGSIDFLIGALRDKLLSSDIKQEFLFDDTLSILMRPDHPLARHSSLDQSALLKFPWVMPPVASPLYGHFKMLFDGQNLPTDLIETNAFSVARVLLTTSDRLMLLSDAQARHELNNEQLISRPIQDQIITRTIGLTVRKGWKPTQMQTSLLKYLSSTIQ